MKKILGLDLGVNSIGWAMVQEADKAGEKSKIIKLGVRVNPLTVDENKNFTEGKPLTTNSDRTLKRGARRNLHRYKLRRKNLIDVLIQNQIINEKTPLTEVGKATTFQTLFLRAKAARKRIELDELARVLLAINKKRGYKSSRKSVQADEGVAIDGMQTAKHLYDNGLTPGQYALQILESGKKYIPDFYRSDLQKEFDAIWNFQKEFYPDVLDEELYKALKGQSKVATSKRFLAIKGIYTAENKGKREEVKLKAYQWRVAALKNQLTIEEVANVLVEINNDLNKSSGYLGAISDRSKELYFNRITVGEYLSNQIKESRHNSLKNQVFYRQDYLDEFEQIWETQAKYHSKLTPELKETIRDIIIFYQRKLKSQKGLINLCQFERRTINYTTNDGKSKYKEVGLKAVPKSSPLFQEFKVWSNLNLLEFEPLKLSPENKEKFKLEDEQRQQLFEELNLRGNLSQRELLKLLGLSSREWKTNFKVGLQGNSYFKNLFEAFQEIASMEGYGMDWAKKTAPEIKEGLAVIFSELAIDVNILEFNANLEGKDFENQAAFQLWHLLYAAEDDDAISKKDQLVFGNSSVTLKKNLVKKFGFKPEHAKILAGVSLPSDYGSLSAKAIRKIIPFLQEGNIYSEACALAGYNHSDSITKEENDQRPLEDKLSLLPKNSLRNPVVEKILNQMVNLVNQIIENYGKPDEIRIELARELKKSAAERKDTTDYINKATAENEEIKKLIQKEEGFVPTKNDVTKYKLWQELSENAHHSLFGNKHIPREKLFTKEIEIEHIIPKSLLFDDSFSNKTLAYRDINLAKSNRTAYDFMQQDYQSRFTDYLARVQSLYTKRAIKKGKYKKLLAAADSLGDFTNRDLVNTRYISKKSKEILLKIVPEVLPTSGRITDKLRQDWDLVNVMKELNIDKYRALGLTTIEERKHGKTVEVIMDWTKRNDHRHHAMDALAIAFTSRSHIQYINNLNARSSENIDNHYEILGIEKKIIQKNKNGRRHFTPPMNNFRQEAKKYLEDILISFKTKNKVVTQNINRSKKKSGLNQKVQLTPRGQLHKETIYGKIKQPAAKESVLNKRFTKEKAELIIHAGQRKLVLQHLAQFQDNPNQAFDSKTLKKNPILWNNEPLKTVHCFEEFFTIRKDISPDLKVDKVVDSKIKQILKDRLKEYGSAKKAFSDLAKNPIWLNKEKGISIKRVSIYGPTNVESLHTKKNHFGQEILDNEGKPIPSDFVQTGNNHHVAIYKDIKGELKEKVVPFFEAVQRVNLGLPVIDKEYNQHLGWQFLFTMKQNEMFIFPNEEDAFDPEAIDLMDESLTKQISKNLFRVQKISTKNYLFAHHLESKAITGDDLKNKKNLAGKSYHLIQSTSKLKSLVKVRINHIGKIVHIGEY